MFRRNDAAQPLRPTRLRRLLCVPLIGLLAFSAAACAGDGGVAATRAFGKAQAAAAQSTSPADTGAQAPNSDPSAVPTAVEYTTTDSSGNVFQTTIGMGRPVGLGAVDDPAIAACDGYMQSFGSEASLSLAVPITVQVAVTSSLPATAVIDLSNWYVADSGGGTLTTLSSKYALAEEGGDGPSCHQFGETATIGKLIWSDLQPGNPGTWRGWYLVFGAITPNDPTGAASDANRVMVRVPGLVVGVPGVSISSRANLVTCPGQLVQGDLIAANPPALRRFGCVHA